MLPWHWLLITQDGDVRPCSHGASPIGNLRRQTLEEIWNGRSMQELRASILAGKIHSGCCARECPFQQSQVAIPSSQQPAFLGENFAFGFDDKHYLKKYADVRNAVEDRQFVSGLEHFLRHGQYERRKFRQVSRFRSKPVQFVYRQLALRLKRWDLLMPGRSLRDRNAIHAIEEYNRGMTVVRSVPVDLVLSLTTSCNLRCVMCPQGRGLMDKPQQMPANDIEKILPWIQTASRVCMSGVGEQTSADVFDDLMKMGPYQKDRSLWLNTNGHFVAGKKVRALLDSGVTKISFSLDAATSSTYSKIRGGDYETVLNNISGLLSARAHRARSKVKVCINMTLMKENLVEAADFVALAKKLGVDAVEFYQLYAFGDDPSWRVARDDWLFVYPEQMVFRYPDEARLHVRAARDAAKRLSVHVRYLNNVACYL